MRSYEGRRTSYQRHSRKTTSTQTPKRYLKNFGRQLFIASLCLTVIFFAKDIDNPNIRSLREATKYAINYSIDYEWIKSSISALLQSRTKNAQPQDSVPAAAPITPEENSDNAQDNPSQATQS